MNTCKHKNVYFVGTVGMEYCPDCQIWDDFQQPYGQMVKRLENNKELNFNWSMKEFVRFQVWNKIEGRPATPFEIIDLARDGDYLTMYWHSNPNESQEGMVDVVIDPARENEFEIRKL